jgi:hypothetical protein
MPRIADSEIAATWDEIELEAALKGGSGEAPTAPSRLFEALRAVEELQRLPKGERKLRAEELLRALTAATAIPAPEQAVVPAIADPILAAEPPAVELPVSPEIMKPLAPEATSAETVAASAEILELVAYGPPDAEAAAGASPEIVDLPAADATSAKGVAVSSQILELVAYEPPCTAPAAETSGEITEPAASPSPLAVTPETSEPPESPPGVAEPVEEALVPSTPASSAAVATVDDLAAATATNASVADPPEAVAPKPSPIPVAAAESYPIPKFLATECPSLEPEHLDSLIPLRMVATACAVIGAVLLIYFGSSQEFGRALHPTFGASEPATSRAARPEVPPSLAVRQAFVAAPLAYSTASEPLRSYRPPFVGFDFLDESLPPAPVVTAAVPPPPQAAPPAPAQVEAPPEPTPEAQIAPQAPAEETAAVLPVAPSLPPDADVTALIKRGDALLKAGDIAAARSAYERAAAGGSAKAQIGVGKTFDPLVLAKLGARGVRGDPVQAAAWYARAGEAGDEEGQQRLEALISGLSDCVLAPGNCATHKPQRGSPLRASGRSGGDGKIDDEREMLGADAVAKAAVGDPNVRAHQHVVDHQAEEGQPREPGRREAAPEPGIDKPPARQ